MPPEPSQRQDPQLSRCGEPCSGRAPKRSLCSDKVRLNFPTVVTISKHRISLGFVAGLVVILCPVIKCCCHHWIVGRYCDNLVLPLCRRRNSKFTARELCLYGAVPSSGILAFIGFTRSGWSGLMYVLDSRWQQLQNGVKLQWYGKSDTDVQGRII